MCIQIQYHCKIIDGKDVEVSLEEDMLDFDKDENSSKVSLATIACIRQTCKEEESRVRIEVIDQSEESQLAGASYTPHLRNNGNKLNKE